MIVLGLVLLIIMVIIILLIMMMMIIMITIIIIIIIIMIQLLIINNTTNNKLASRRICRPRFWVRSLRAAAAPNSAPAAPSYSIINSIMITVVNS